MHNECGAKRTFGEDELQLFDDAQCLLQLRYAVHHRLFWSAGFLKPSGAPPALAKRVRPSK